MPPAVDLRRLRYFVAVAEELHFGRAAERLGMAQPPLSQQIQRLEAEFGFPLLVRRPRVALTPAGEAFIRTARRTLGYFEEDVAYVRRVARGDAGLLRLGFAASTLLTVLPAVIRAFRQEYPDVEVRLLTLSTAEQLEALARGRCDVGVLREPPEHPALAYEALAREPFVAVLPPGHPLGCSPRVRVAALAGERFVHFPRHVAPSLHEQVVSICRAAGFAPNIAQVATEWFTIVGLVEAGMGVTIVPASFRRLRWGRIVYRPLTPRPPLSVVRLGYRRDADVPTVREFLGVARRIARSGR